MSDDALRSAILALTTARGHGKTACPSEVARAVAGGDGDWRALMHRTRGIAANLASEGRIEVTQKGVVVDVVTARGPVRLRLPSGQDR